MFRPSRWRRPARMGRASVRTLLLAFALAAGLGGTSAYAGADAYCSGCWVSSGLQVFGPSHSLTASRGTNLTSGAGCGGAYAYGSYFCGTPAGCHTYSGDVVLTPGIRHLSGTGKYMNGYSTWGSTPPPSNCSFSSVYATGKAPSAATRNPDGIPVLDRDTEAAPAGLSVFLPKADLSAARRVETPAGDAWVVVDPTARLVCLAVDDRGTGYGYTCQRIGEVQAAGVLSTLEDGDPTTARGDLVIAVAADGVDALDVERKDGSVRRVPVDRGVVVTTLGEADAVVSLPRSDDAPAGVKARRYVVSAG